MDLSACPTFWVNIVYLLCICKPRGVKVLMNNRLMLLWFKLVSSRGHESLLVRFHFTQITKSWVFQPSVHPAERTTPISRMTFKYGWGFFRFLVPWFNLKLHFLIKTIVHNDFLIYCVQSILLIYSNLLWAETINRNHGD